MDFFVFSNYTLDAKGIVDYPYSTLEGATLIPDITSATWVERYLEPGEFSFTAPQDSQVRTLVPVGSIISQVEAQECMIVENHEIAESNDGQMEVKVSGRSFEVLLENRAIGQDGVLGQVSVGSGGYVSYPMSLTTGERWGIFYPYRIQNKAAIYPVLVDGEGFAIYTVVGNFQRPSDQVEYIVNRLFGTREAFMPNQNPAIPHFQNPDAIDYPRPIPYQVPNADTINFLVFINTDFTTAVPPLNPDYAITIEGGDAHKAVMNILGAENMGIATFRAGETSPIDFHGHGIPHDWPASYKNKLALLIYYGNDRREAVQFSYAGGDIENANYLWSNKNEKNSFFSAGNTYGMLYRGETGYKQRTMHVDMSQIDNQTGAGTIPPFSEYFHTTFHQRGMQELAKRENQRSVIMEAKLISQQKDLIYRRDYGTGDLVTVIGNHGFKETMQVIEYIETEDEKGETAFPTLVIPSQATIAKLEKPVGQRI